MYASLGLETEIKNRVFYEGLKSFSSWLQGHDSVNFCCCNDVLCSIQKQSFPNVMSKYFCDLLYTQNI